MFENFRADLEHARKVNTSRDRAGQMLKVLFQPTTLAVASYRMGHWVTRLRIPVLRQLLRISTALMRYFVEIATGVHISPMAEIGPGFVVHTPYGVFIGPVTIGKNCVVQHGVAITYGVKRIGDNVYFGPGAKVIGHTTIGDNVVVVANSLVMTDVPDDMTVVGVPARIRWPRGKTLRFDKPKAARRGVSREPLEAVGKGKE